MGIPGPAFVMRSCLLAVLQILHLNFTIDFHAVALVQYLLKQEEFVVFRTERIF